MSVPHLLLVLGETSSSHSMRCALVGSVELLALDNLSILVTAVVIELQLWLEVREHILELNLGQVRDNDIVLWSIFLAGLSVDLS